jgi:hypothetical protein
MVAGAEPAQVGDVGRALGPGDAVVDLATADPSAAAGEAAAAVPMPDEPVQGGPGAVAIGRRGCAERGAVAGGAAECGQVGEGDQRASQGVDQGDPGSFGQPDGTLVVTTPSGITATTEPPPFSYGDCPF